MVSLIALQLDAGASAHTSLQLRNAGENIREFGAGTHSCFLNLNLDLFDSGLAQRNDREDVTVHHTLSFEGAIVACFNIDCLSRARRRWPPTYSD